jgi:hypothetical protein
VDVSPAKGGTVEVNQVTLSDYPVTGDYASSSNVSFKAVPASGYQFVNWSGDLSGTDNPATLRMDCAKKVTASFTPVESNWRLWLAVGGGVVDVIVAGAIAWLLVKRRKIRAM